MFSSFRLRASLTIAICLFAVAGAEVSGSRASQTGNCADVLVISSRGSGTNASSKDWGGGLGIPAQKFVTSLRAMLSKDKVQVQYNPYAAVGILPTISDIIGALRLNPAGLVREVRAIQDTLNGVGALARSKRFGAYHDSVINGGITLHQMIDSAIAQPCAMDGTRLILVGYSQGAQVTGDVYRSLSPSEKGYIAGVVLFGDPKYNPDDSSNHFGLNDPNPKNRWTRNQGILNKRPAFNNPEVWSFCHRGDPVCQGAGQWLHARAHTNYGQFNEPQLAARDFVAKLMGGTKKPGLPPAEKWPTERHDGSPGFFAYLGASFIWPNWSSCNVNYCIVGADGKVYAFSMSNRIDEAGSIPDSVEPRSGLKSLDIPHKDIDELLRRK